MLEIEINESEQWLLAQFIKRLSFNDILGCAIDQDEAYAMRDVIYKIQDALQSNGVNPR